jgi:hypothetical protein
MRNKLSPANARSQRRHAIKRANERFGLIFYKEDLNKLVKIIQTEDGITGKRIDSRLTLFYIVYRDVSMHVVYDRVNKSIATVMPPDWPVQGSLYTYNTKNKRWTSISTPLPDLLTFLRDFAILSA